MIAFFDFVFFCLFGLPNLLQSSISFELAVTSVSEKIDITVASNWLPKTFSGIPDNIKLFFLPH